MEHKFGAAAIIGPPNAGKSTFLNQILGQKIAIVTPKPQTTRNRISGIWTGEDAQVVFLDTPGIHRLRGKMNSFLLKSAWQALAGADVAVLFLDAALYADKPHVFDKDMAPIKKELAQAGAQLLIAANKVDKVHDKRKLLSVLGRIGEMFPDAEIFPVAAINGDGLDGLLEKVVSMLPEGPPMFPEDQVSTVPMRFLAAEIVREKLFMELRQELPYQTTVEIEHWEEEDGLVRIAALIYTARKTHKGIIIGKGGATLKKVGQSARTELEDMLQCKVFLQIWVKIREGWTEDPGFLRSLGFGE
ncbi:MAG: GTPase Era [Desulfovibrio sp.]|uniref:GTPase Era n=1 Tax=Desulfovibrio sp. 7SRBS1 TaxID=3378064 RepID=UPI003B3C372F